MLINDINTKLATLVDGSNLAAAQNVVQTVLTSIEDLEFNVHKPSEDVESDVGEGAGAYGIELSPFPAVSMRKLARVMTHGTVKDCDIVAPTKGQRGLSIVSIIHKQSQKAKTQGVFKSDMRNRVNDKADSLRLSKEDAEQAKSIQACFLNMSDMQKRVFWKFFDDRDDDTYVLTAQPIEAISMSFYAHLCNLHPKSLINVVYRWSPSGPPCVEIQCRRIAPFTEARPARVPVAGRKRARHEVADASDDDDNDDEEEVPRPARKKTIAAGYFH